MTPANPRANRNIYRTLRSEIAELKAELSAMKAVMGIPPSARAAFGLSKSQNVIFSLLMSRELVTRDAIMQVLYGLRPGDAPEGKTIDVLMTFTRKRLPSWVRITSDYNNGWFIAPTIKTRLRQTLAVRAITSDYAPVVSRAPNGHDARSTA